MQYKIVLEYSPLENYKSVPFLSLSAFLLNANEKAEGKGCFVYYRNPLSDNKAVRHHNSENASSEKNKKEIITVDVNSIPESIHKIVFVVTTKDGENTPLHITQAKETGTCSLFNNESEYPAHYLDIADANFEGGAVFFEIVRSQTGWTERIIATGNKNTLNDFAKTYGIETEKIELSQEIQQQKEKREQQQQKMIEENVRLQEKNKLLKQQLQTERNRNAKLQEECNRLTKENNLLFEQQLRNSNLLPELQILFSESSLYHFTDTQFRDTLEGYRSKLANVQNLNAMLDIVEELRTWWNTYRIQNTIRLSFWRPDSWSRFEDKFPNHPITIKLMHFTK